MNTIVLTTVAMVIAMAAFGAQIPTSKEEQSSPTLEQVTIRLERVAKVTDFPQETARADARTVWDVLSKGNWEHVPPRAEVKLEAGVATWASIRLPTPGNVNTPLQFDVVFQRMSDLRQLVVESTPPDASVDVDRYRWEDRTRANGFAQIGTRQIVVTGSGASVAFKCEVTTKRATVASVDLRANIGSCR